MKYIDQFYLYLGNNDIFPIKLYDETDSFTIIKHSDYNNVIIDLEKYPIYNLNSPKIKNLIKKCKKELDQYSCSTIPNFILPKSPTCLSDDSGSP